MNKVVLPLALILTLTGCEAANAIHTSGFDKAIFSAALEWFTGGQPETQSAYTEQDNKK